MCACHSLQVSTHTHTHTHTHKHTHMHTTLTSPVTDHFIRVISMLSAMPVHLTGYGRAGASWQTSPQLVLQRARESLELISAGLHNNEPDLLMLAFWRVFRCCTSSPGACSASPDDSGCWFNRPDQYLSSSIPLIH